MAPLVVLPWTVYGSRGMLAACRVLLVTSSSSSSSSHRHPRRHPGCSRWHRASESDMFQDQIQSRTYCRNPTRAGELHHGDSNLAFRSNCDSDRDGSAERQLDPDSSRAPDLASASHTDYEEAIKVLNRLQTNAQKLEETRRERGRQASNQLPMMARCLQRCRIDVGDLDRLNIVHVSGTKGKGSTCAFTERILHKHGFKTGLYSSPHLVQVRERIRINGQPISEQLYTKYFWEIYNRLDETKDSGNPMPAYFRFLTIMAFHVFLQEKVDLAVVEVGIGGAYDCTNIVRKPVVCGVASLGMDHTGILGNTIEKIAWQKGGIFKPGVPAFTVEQPPSAMAVLQECARDIHCPLQVCPPLSAYAAGAGQPELGVAGEHQRLNATLALQLCREWLRRVPRLGLPPSPPASLHDGSEGTPAETEANGRAHDVAGYSSLLTAAPFPLSPQMLQGLKETEWPGRSQVLRRGPITFYLDGAHTVQSIQACVKWFKESVLEEDTTMRIPAVRVLLFNMTGDRDSAAMLRLLQACQFDCAVFCPNITEMSPDSSDQVNYTVYPERVMAQCERNRETWDELHRDGATPSRVAGLAPPERDAVPDLLSLATSRKSAIPPSAVFPCIAEALRWIGTQREPERVRVAGASGAGGRRDARRAVAVNGEIPRVQVLITGSLHLVGGVLKCLESGLS